MSFIVFASRYWREFALNFTKKKVTMKNVLIYSFLKNCQQGKLPARINFSPNKPLSTPYLKPFLGLYRDIMTFRFKISMSS